MEGVVRALPLGQRVAAWRALGTNPDGRGIAAFVETGRLLAAAQTRADLRAATDKLAVSAQEMGLDRFKPFLREADNHLARTGGIMALLGDLPKSVPPLVRPAVMTPLVRSGLPALGDLIPFLRVALLDAGLVVAAAGLLQTLSQRSEEQHVRAAIERFHLDPAKPGDMAAAVAFVWADNNRLLLTVTGHEIGQPGALLPESAQGTVAERVMRAVQKDPALLDRVLSGNPGALGTVRSIIQTVASELGVVTRNEEERQFVARLTAEGKSKQEIETALDEFRKHAEGMISLTRSRFGHTFDRHGQNATEFLKNRARAMDLPNGQFLDDQAAARFIRENLSKTNNGPVSLPMPDGFPARVVNPDGTFSPARTIRLVPGGNGVKSAFPEP